MAFKFDQIDNIDDFDQALDVLRDSYIENLINEFLKSPEGKEYLQTSGEDKIVVGDWIGNFIFFGYTYCDRTLPKMRKQDAKEILTRLFPGKLTISNPDDAHAVIPELIAFWKFLQRQYKPRNSKKILEFLHHIQPDFVEIMNDPRNFGIAKSFMISGREAGFDMRTEEGITAFQQQYNQQIQENSSSAPGFPRPSLSVPEGVPPEFLALLSQLSGNGPLPGLEHLPTDTNQLVSAIAQHLVDSGTVQIMDQDSDGQDEVSDIFEDVNLSMMRDVANKIDLSDEAIARLTELTITDNAPGTIIKDFETILAELLKQPLPVSGRLHQFQAKVAIALNDKLSRPIQIDLKRPVQRSLPNIHGLYLLLCTTGLGEVMMYGKKPLMTINSRIFESWQTLNATEKYLTLLEAWIIRGDAELLGEDRNPLREGTRVLKSWQQDFPKTVTYSDYNAQNGLNYWPGFHNVALLELFGWIELTTPKPQAGKGWRIQQIKPLPLGDAMVSLLVEAFMQNKFSWASQSDPMQSWGELQPYLNPYFPEWQKNLASINPTEHQIGTYIFKVSLGRIWRRISISSESTLETLAALILQSVDFDQDHLDMFVIRDRTGRTIEVNHPYNDWADPPFSDQILIGDLPLQVGAGMTYIFDFGDHWQFSIVLEDIQPGRPKRNCNKILERRGKAPEQYPDWE